MAELSGIPGAPTYPVVGTWDAVDPANAFLTFTPTDSGTAGGGDGEDTGSGTRADGTSGAVSGGDGCNGVGGTYQADDDGTVHIARGFGTLKACIGVDDWLRKVSSVRVDADDEDLMHVFNGRDEEIGRLHRRAE